MATVLRQLRVWGSFPLLLALLGMLLVACTDKRQPERKFNVNMRAIPQVLEPVSDVRLDEQDISVFQMAQKAGTIYLTGASANAPFGFMKWDIMSDAEAPHPTFIAAKNINQFQPMGRWRPDWYASGAIGIIGPYAITSGMAGASFIDMSQTAQPVETRRYPPIDPNSEQTPKDENYIYKAIAMHPSQPIMYGLKEQDYMVVSKVTSSGISIIGRVNYGSGPVCCVTGATVFNNKLFVAMRGMLRMYELGSNGSLSAPTDLNMLQAVDVVSSGNLLYVQHEPTFAQSAGSSNAAGIYVFDANGNSQAFFAASPKRFTVAADDMHLYANMDDTSVRIFRIQWTNR